VPVVFVTGGSGFVGGRLIERLREDGYTVRAPARSDRAAARIRARGGADSPVLYSSTKARAEQLVLDANQAGFETVVVRPRFVWGRGDTTLLPTMVELARSGRFARIGGGRHRTSTTHVDNAVEGLVLGASSGTPGIS
jgi:nucleoside-diphosphate-sugar epimerase